MHRNTFKNIISYLVRHPEYFTQSIETMYPFTQSQLKKYSSVLNWQRLSNNPNITWTAELLYDFTELLDWVYLSTNPGVFKSELLINEFEERIDWDGNTSGRTIASNEGVPWSIELIEKYSHKLDFEYLSGNEHLPWTEKLIEKFYDRWYFPALTQNNALPWSLPFFENYFIKKGLHDCYFESNDSIYGVFEIIDKWNGYFQWHSIWKNHKLPWIEKNLLNYWKDHIQWHSIACNEFLLSQDGFLEDHLVFFQNSPHSFHNLSYNEGIRWTPELIERFKDLWRWKGICLNTSIPWSIELIEKYSDRLVWGYYEEYRRVEDLTEEQKEEGVELGMIHPGLVDNPALPWSIEFLQYYENEIDDRMLLMNTAVWKKVFEPYVDDKVIELVLRII